MLQLQVVVGHNLFATEEQMSFFITGCRCFLKETMDNSDGGLASSAWTDPVGSTDGNDLPEPDYSNLDLSFDEVIEFDGTRTPLSQALNGLEKSEERQEHRQSARVASELGTNSSEITLFSEEEYILGTLVVRVVAARDLTPVENNSGGGIGSLLGLNASSSQRRSRLGGGGGGSRNYDKRGGGGGANPYASVRFGSSIQRTSQVFDSTDPIWPRGENMFLDVTHPVRIPQASSATHKPNNMEDTAPSNTTSEESSISLQKPPPKATSESHPGDPPKKPSVSVATNSAGSSDRNFITMASLSGNTPQPRRPILVVAIFHAATKDIGGKRYNPSKVSKSSSGDSDDVFLGMAAIDITTLLTGKDHSIDAWLPLSGGPSNNNNDNRNNGTMQNAKSGSVRIVCEYEASDAPPRPGDLVRFTGYCNPVDLYPLHHNELYKVEEDHEIDRHLNQHHDTRRESNTELPNYDNEDYVTISFTTPEGWTCSTVAHRYMLLCEERHQGALLEVYQDGFVTLGERFSRSPLVHTLQDSLERLPDEGLVSLGVAALQGGGSLFQRWIREGVNTVVQDIIVHATNLDGRNDPSAEERLAEDSNDEFYEAREVEDDPQQHHDSSRRTSESTTGSTQSLDAKLNSAEQSSASTAATALPNMPCCPITGEPMSDPVVAADGHTYERFAIARWLKTSDKSPLTGSLLPHKNLVTNYMLMSSLQQLDAASSTTAAAAQAEPEFPSQVVTSTLESEIVGLEDQDLK